MNFQPPHQRTCAFPQARFVLCTGLVVCRAWFEQTRIWPVVVMRMVAIKDIVWRWRRVCEKRKENGGDRGKECGRLQEQMTRHQSSQYRYLQSGMAGAGGQRSGKRMSGGGQEGKVGRLKQWGRG